jgi:hypothetical protein
VKEAGAEMFRDESSQALPDIVQELKSETDELIRLADKAFLGMCGIAWEDDISRPCGLIRG